MPVFATSVIFGVFAMPVFSGIYHWNLPAGQYLSQPCFQEIQDLITSWDEHIKLCDKIFLRAPSFNRKIFFGGKTPPFKKDDMRIRLIPFQTRRPTFNEVRRVYELLASVECYGKR